MKATIEKKEKNVVSFRVEIPTEEVEKDIDRAYKSLSNRVKIPGFRAGKIPNSIIDSRIGKERVYTEYADMTLPEFYRDAISQLDLRVIDMPKIKIEEIGEGKSFIFSGTVEVMPELKLGEYKNVPVSVKEIKITAKEVDNQLNLLKNKFAILEPIKADFLKTGHFALVDIEATMGGKKIGKLSSTDSLLEFGSGKIDKYFENKLLGMKKGEMRNIEITYPLEYFNKELAGKTGDYSVTLKDIKRKVLPELNDDFAKQMGIETIRELKSNIKKRLLSAKEMQKEALIRSEVIKEVSNRAQLEVPKIFEERYAENERRNLKQRLEKEGLSLEQYLEMMKISETDLEEQIKKNAQFSIKTELVLEAIGEKEKIEVTEEELEKEIESALEKRGKEKAKLERFFANKENREMIRKEMFRDKIIDFLVKNAKITIETSEKPGKEEKNITKEKILDKGKEKK